MTDPRTLIHGYLDGVLTADEEVALNEWVKADPANTAEFATAVRLHDRLRAAFAPATLPPLRPAVPGTDPSRRVGWLVGLAAVLLFGLYALWWLSPTPMTAAAELDRLIEGSAGSGDRTYVIRTLDSAPEQFDDRRPPIDGATLHVRSPDRYLLVRKFPDGRPFATGCDGERSWSVPPAGAGAVRVSGDPLRFRGPLPGHQHGIPFVNLRSDLVQLRDSYTVTPLPQDASGRRGLLAEKKSAEHRGPRRVELRYDPASGVIQRMVFAGMPKARGGPDALVVELVHAHELPADFFQHTAHHTPDRRVIEEDQP
jgi:hypothetical protein